MTILVDPAHTAPAAVAELLRAGHQVTYSYDPAHPPDLVLASGGPPGIAERTAWRCGVPCQYPRGHSPHAR